MNRFLTNCLFVSVAAGIVLTAATQATATSVVDQSQLSANQGIPWPGDVPNGQSFTAGLTGLLTEIDFFSNGENTGGTATLQVHSGDGLGGPLLGSVTQSFGSTGGDLPIAFDVSSLNIPVTAGSVYTFDVASFSGSQQVESDNNNPYAGGNQYNNAGFYGNTPTWDLKFQTFVSVAVPEPSSMLLAAFGLAGVAACVWRQKRSA